MTSNEALKSLSANSRRFLEHLRPFNGELDEVPLHEIMRALRVLHPVVRKDAATGLRTATELHNMAVLARINAINPDCPLRRDRIISSEQVATLSMASSIEWIW